MMPPLESIGSIPGAIGGTLLLFAAAWSLGSFFTARLPNQRALLTTVVGLNLVAWIGVTAGQLGLLADGRSVWLLACCVALGVPRAWPAWQQLRSSATAPRRRSPYSLGRMGLVIALAAVALGPALCPPTGWDELVYHHELPRRWLASGRPAFYADLAYSGFPSLGEILFWLVAPLEHAIAPRLIVWGCWMMGLTLVHRLVRRRIAAWPALLLTLALAASSAVLMISANCYVESILLMNVAAMLVVCDEPRRIPGARPERTPAALLGILAGGAAAVKLTGLAVLALPCLWYLAAVCHAGRKRAGMLRAGGMYLLVGAGMCLPFYARPWIATGNPLYPYYAEWFTSDPARIATSQFQHALGDAFGDRSLAGLVLSPLRLAYADEFYDGSFGWQFVLLGGLSLLAVVRYGRSRRRRPALWPAAVFAWLFGFWFLTAQQGRFAVPAVAALLVLAPMGMRILRGANRTAVLALLAGATLASAPWPTAGHYFGSWFTASGVVRKSDYVNIETDGHYVPLLAAIAGSTPAEAKVMLLYEHRGYYLPRAYAIGTPGFQEGGFTPVELSADLSAVQELLAREQITHVVATRHWAGPERAPALAEQYAAFSQALERWSREGRWQLVWQSEKYGLFEVPPPNNL